MIKVEKKNYQINQAQELAVNRKYGDLAMRMVVFGWLFFQLYTYHLMATRPVELFAPINWFDKIFMPVFPSIGVWYVVWLIAFGSNILLFFRGENKHARLALAALVLWINCIRWKYEFFSHVGHVMVLYHLLGMFLPRKDKISAQDSELLDYAKAIKWLFAGLLIGYTFSGIWKVVGLGYKVFWHPDQINWLHPLAMKLNSIVGYRDWDISLDHVGDLYSVLWVWQIAFVLMLILQVVSVLGAIRQQLTPYIALGNILFHLINSWLIHIEFYLTPIVLLAVFFPYHLVFKREQDLHKSEKLRAGNLYQRSYTDGSKDEYIGFEAWRAYKYDQNPLVYGIFFLPGLPIFLDPFFKKNPN